MKTTTVTLCHSELATLVYALNMGGHGTKRLKAKLAAALDETRAAEPLRAD